MRPRLWLAIFVLLQLADGLLTYAAVSRFGIGVEGNPIVATWIVLTGAAPALVGAKMLACGCGAVLYAAGVHRILAALSAFYFVAAVVPWLQIMTQLGVL
jgi:hypothetical protein